MSQSPATPNRGDPAWSEGAIGKMKSKSRALRKELKQVDADRDLRPRASLVEGMDNSSLLSAAAGAGGGGGGGSGADGPRALMATLQSDWDRRQTSYVQRERQYQRQIEALEEEIGELKGASAAAASTYSAGGPPVMVERKMGLLHGMHEHIVSNLDASEERTTKILREQERNLMRAFRARVYDTSKELADVRFKKDDGAQVWKSRARELEKELEWAREMGERLRKVNQELTDQNRDLKVQYRSGEDDRAYLVRQVQMPTRRVHLR